jgi:hypothetical protein
LDDVVVDVTRPHLRLRRGTTKGGHSRRVPLWWDGLQRRPGQGF